MSDWTSNETSKVRNLGERRMTEKPKFKCQKNTLNVRFVFPVELPFWHYLHAPLPATPPRRKSVMVPLRVRGTTHTLAETQSCQKSCVIPEYYLLQMTEICMEFSSNVRFAIRHAFNVHEPWRIVLCLLCMSCICHDIIAPTTSNVRFIMLGTI